VAPLADNRVPKVAANNPITKEDGSPSDQLLFWFNLMTNRALIIGTGSPETFYEAAKGTVFMDESGTTGSILYIKKSADIGGDKTQGWILV